MEKELQTINGIKIYDYRNKKIGSFALSLFLKRGAMFDSEEESGTAHLFEHAVFRHLNHLYSGNLYKKLDSSGLAIDAVTTYHYIQFEITGAAAHFSEAAKILTDIFLPFSFGKNELDPEKDRVKAEIRENGDSTSLGTFCDKIVWENGALSQSISGTAKTVNGIGIKKLSNLQKEMLSAENVFFYAAGNFSDQSLDELIALTEALTLKSSDPVECVVSAPANFGNRNREVHIKNSTYTCVQMCFDIPVSSRNLPALYLLYDIIFAGNTALMHDALSEQSGLIYSFNSGFDTYKNLSALYFSFDIRKDKLYRSIEESMKVFASVSENVEEYIKYALPEYTDNYAMTEDSPSKLTSIFGFESHILDLPYRSADERKSAFASVTAEDLRKLAKQIFRPECLTLTIKANKKTTDKERLRSYIDLLNRA